jgi:RsiW-degrading membrane proteinase PrsW (M82 family)
MTDIPLPDHPIRKHWAWQAFDRLWRTTAGWVVVIGTAYAGFIGHAIGKPMNEGYLAVWLTFAAAVLGLKSWEKLKGVA